MDGRGMGGAWMGGAWVGGAWEGHGWGGHGRGMGGAWVSGLEGYRAKPVIHALCVNCTLHREGVLIGLPEVEEELCTPTSQMPGDCIQIHETTSLYLPEQQRKVAIATKHPMLAMQLMLVSGTNSPVCWPGARTRAECLEFERMMKQYCHGRSAGERGGDRGGGGRRGET